MELVLVFLSTAIGTAVGVTAAIFIATDAGTEHKKCEIPAGECAAERKRIAAARADFAAEREKVAELSSELTRWRESSGRAEKDHIVLERQLFAELEKAGALACELAAMRSANASLETTLQRERESATEGMKLLLLLQNKLSGAAPAPPAVVANGYANETAAYRIPPGFGQFPGGRRLACGSFHSRSYFFLCICLAPNVLSHTSEVEDSYGCGSGARDFSGVLPASFDDADTAGYWTLTHARKK